MHTTELRVSFPILTANFWKVRAGNRANELFWGMNGKEFVHTCP